MKSTQITVRNVDPVLKQRIDKLAKMKSMSLNDFVLDTLRIKVDLKPADGMDKGYDWGKYGGIVAEGGINQDVLDEFEMVDEKMWKP